jgi:hypothetical protein
LAAFGRPLLTSRPCRIATGLLGVQFLGTNLKTSDNARAGTPAPTAAKADPNASAAPYGDEAEINETYVADTDDTGADDIVAMLNFASASAVAAAAEAMAAYAGPSFVPNADLDY